MRWYLVIPMVSTLLMAAALPIIAHNVHGLVDKVVVLKWSQLRRLAPKSVGRKRSLLRICTRPSLETLTTKRPLR